MNTHEQYEELCALAASGQASPDELADLRSHLEDCPSCRSAAYDFTQISAQALSQLAAKRLHCQIPSGMTQRFVARARSEGIEMSREKYPDPGRKSAMAFSRASAPSRRSFWSPAFLSIGRQKSPRSWLAAQAVGRSRSSQTADFFRRDSFPERSRIARLQQELASARSEMTSMDAKIQKQRGDA